MIDTGGEYDIKISVQWFTKESVLQAYGILMEIPKNINNTSTCYMIEYDI